MIVSNNRDRKREYSYTVAGIAVLLCALEVIGRLLLVYGG